MDHMAVNVAVRCYSDMDMFRFWLPFVSAPQRLVPGSCVAARLWARVRFRGGDRLTLSPAECALRQTGVPSASGQSGRCSSKLKGVMPL